ncbi:hypothetical protein DP57_5926 [Burkholderia pseudomallei]|nr:hypothetical protein DP57_5926 [Burkholderia pseudomallei]
MVGFGGRGRFEWQERGSVRAGQHLVPDTRDLAPNHCGWHVESLSNFGLGQPRIEQRQDSRLIGGNASSVHFSHAKTHSRIELSRI